MCTVASVVSSVDWQDFFRLLTLLRDLHGHAVTKLGEDEV